MYIKTLLIILALASLACVQSAALPRTTPEAGTAASSTALSPNPQAGPKCLRAQTKLHIRAAPSEKSQVLFWLQEGQTAKIQAVITDWSLVTFGNLTGFVKTKYTKEIDCDPRKTQTRVSRKR